MSDQMLTMERLREAKAELDRIAPKPALDIRRLWMSHRMWDALRQRFPEGEGPGRFGGIDVLLGEPTPEDVRHGDWWLLDNGRCFPIPAWLVDLAPLFREAAP